VSMMCWTWLLQKQYSHEAPYDQSRRIEHVAGPMIVIVYQSVHLSELNSRGL
jgi:hypothetical protein